MWLSPRRFSGCNTVATIAAVFEENSAATDEVSASCDNIRAQVDGISNQADELAAMADHLKELIGQFRLEDAGTERVVAHLRPERRQSRAAV